MKRYYLFCVVLALLPLFVLVMAAVGLEIFDCGNLGPSQMHCGRGPDKLGGVLAGLSYLGAFGWLLTVPAALVLALLGRIFGKSKTREEN